MPRQRSANRSSLARKATPNRTKNTPRVNKRIPSKSPSKKGKSSAKRENNIMKVVHNCLKRNEQRMNLAQKSIFSNLIKDEIMDKSKGIYDKLNRAIQTYNERLKKELVNHVNLKLRIACTERGIFTEEDFSKHSK